VIVWQATSCRKRSKVAVTTRSLETPKHRDLWRGAADLEKAHGSHESFDKQLARAVECCLQTEVLWLMWAREKWLSGDVHVAHEEFGEQTDLIRETIPS
jgi:hypothetical protein